MMSPLPRREVLFNGVAVFGLVFGGGCLAQQDPSSTPAESEANSPTSTVLSEPAETTPDTPTSAEELTDEEARERALAAEEKYLIEQFENASCVDDWGLTAYAGVEENATVSDRTADGVHVEVTHPYWYSTEQDEVDGGSNARYLVSTETVQRIDDSDVSPC